MPGNQKHWAYCSNGGITPCDPPRTGTMEIHAARIGTIEVTFSADHCVMAVTRLADNIICIDHDCLIEARLTFCLYGTDFQHKVWQYLTAIPAGQTVSYGDLAAAIGHDHAAQAVGQALKHNAAPILLPCHRVVGKNNLGGYVLGTSVKKRLLAVEDASPKTQKI